METQTEVKESTVVSKAEQPTLAEKLGVSLPVQIQPSCCICRVRKPDYAIVHEIPEGYSDLRMREDVGLYQYCVSCVKIPMKNIEDQHLDLQIIDLAKQKVSSTMSKTIVVGDAKITGYVITAISQTCLYVDRAVKTSAKNGFDLMFASWYRKDKLANTIESVSFNGSTIAITLAEPVDSINSIHIELENHTEIN